MIEYGLHSPVGVVCENGDKVTVDQLINLKDYELLLALFRGEDVSSQREKLESLDRYLDIPFIEAYFNRTNFNAFKRLVVNG